MVVPVYPFKDMMTLAEIQFTTGLEQKGPG